MRACFAQNIQVGSGTSLVAQTVKRLSTVRETWVQSLGWDDPLEKKMVTHSSILPWEIHGQRSLSGYNPWSLKELDRLSNSHIYFHHFGPVLSPYMLVLISVNIALES